MLRIQSEMDSLYVQSFMTKRNISESSQGLSKLVERINALATQFPEGFSYDAHETGYLGRAVMKIDWAQLTIWQVATSLYTFRNVL